MTITRRALGFISIGIGVVSLLFVMRGGWGRWGDGRHERGHRQPAAVAPQAQAPSNASPDYLRGYADGLEAGQQQSAQQVAPRGARQARFAGPGGHDRRGGPGWFGLLALPLLVLAGLMLLRNRGGRGPWNRGHSNRDLDQPPGPEQPPYTGETRNF